MLNTKFYKKLLKGQITLNSLYSTQLDTTLLNSTSISLINKYIEDVTLYNELFVIEDFQQLINPYVDSQVICVKSNHKYFQTLVPETHAPVYSFSTSFSNINEITARVNKTKNLQKFEYERIQYALQKIYLEFIEYKIHSVLDTTINHSLVYCDSLNQLPYMSEICKKGKNDIGQLNNSFTLKDIKECIKTNSKCTYINTANNVVLLHGKFLNNLTTELNRESDYFIISLNNLTVENVIKHKQTILDFKNNNNNNKLLFILSDFIPYNLETKLTDVIVTNLFNLQTYFKPLKNQNILLTGIWDLNDYNPTIKEEFREFCRPTNSYIFKNINFEKVNTFK